MNAGNLRAPFTRLTALAAPASLAGLAMAATVAMVAMASGCGGSPTAPEKDQVFYLHGSVVDKNQSFETYFQPLDLPATERLPRVVGVGVLSGDVRLGRPIDWYVRSADNTPQHRLISYQSPRQFLFSLFERIDDPEETWTDIERRYEADVAGEGSTILAGRMPVATANTQGRAYILKTRVPARPDYQNFAHEILIRSEHRLLLVQVIHGESMDLIQDEVNAVLKSITMY